MRARLEDCVRLDVRRFEKNLPVKPCIKSYTGTYVLDTALCAESGLIK